MSIRPLRGFRTWLPASQFGRWCKGPFSYAEDKAGGRGGLAVLAVEVGVVGLESLAVKPAAVDVLPAGLPAVPPGGLLFPGPPLLP